MLHNGFLSLCNLVLILLPVTITVAIPLPIPLPLSLPTSSTLDHYILQTRQDPGQGQGQGQPQETPTSALAAIPARATALNVFAAFFTIIVLIVIACYVIIRLMNRAMATLSATVTGSSSSDGGGSSDSSVSLVFFFSFLLFSVSHCEYWGVIVSWRFISLVRSLNIFYILPCRLEAWWLTAKGMCNMFGRVARMDTWSVRRGGGSWAR